MRIITSVSQNEIEKCSERTKFGMVGAIKQGHVTCIKWHQLIFIVFTVVLVVLLSIFVVVSFTLSQVVATDYFKNMFWVASIFLMCGVLLDLNAWSKLGLDVDKTKSRTIRRGFDDSTTLLVVFYASLFLIIVFFNQFNKEVMKNNYVIIGYFIITIEFILFNYLSIWNAKRDTAKLLKDNK